MWTQGMQRLAGQLVGLDGVPAQQDNYRKSGFVLGWRNLRYAGTARHTMSDTDDRTHRIVPLADIDFATVCADDRRVFPAMRERFLRAWIGVPQSAALACISGSGSPAGV